MGGGGASPSCGACARGLFCVSWGVVLYSPEVDKCRRVSPGVDNCQPVSIRVDNDCDAFGCCCVEGLDGEASTQRIAFRFDRARKPGNHRSEGLSRNVRQDFIVPHPFLVLSDLCAVPGSCASVPSMPTTRATHRGKPAAVSQVNPATPWGIPALASISSYTCGRGCVSFVHGRVPYVSLMKYGRGHSHCTSFNWYVAHSVLSHAGGGHRSGAAPDTPTLIVTMEPQDKGGGGGSTDSGSTFQAEVNWHKSVHVQRSARICQIGVCAFCVPWHYVTKQSQLQIGCMKQHEIRCRQHSPPLTHRSQSTHVWPSYWVGLPQGLCAPTLCSCTYQPCCKLFVHGTVVSPPPPL